MEQQAKHSIVDVSPFADVFWRMTYMAFCTGLAVSVIAAGVVLLIGKMASA